MTFSSCVLYPFRKLLSEEGAVGFSMSIPSPLCLLKGQVYKVCTIDVKH